MGSRRAWHELDALVSKLYENWVAGRINETNFTRMMEKAQGEQEALQKKADMMRGRLDGAAKGQADNSKWFSLIRQYADIKELDRGMVFIPCGEEISIKYNQILKFHNQFDYFSTI